MPGIDPTISHRAWVAVPNFHSLSEVLVVGGILVALAAKFSVPVHFVGVGEGVEDLEPFAARDFARAIAGLEQAA